MAATVGSSESELRQIARQLCAPVNGEDNGGLNAVTFLGTFDKRFPGFISRHSRSVAIVNTAGRETGGQHWLAFAWEPATHTVTLFEPFGFSDGGLWQTYRFEYEGLLKRSAIAQSPGDRCVNLVKSDYSVQGPDSAACGLFCCLFIAAFRADPQNPLGDSNPVFGPIRGVPNSRLRDPASLPRLRQNQEYLYEFLARHSPYFRHNRTRICEATAFDKLATHLPSSPPSDPTTTST